MPLSSFTIYICIYAKEPCICAKEPFISTKEFDISAKRSLYVQKESYISTKEPCMSKKSHIYQHKSPVCPKRVIHQQKSPAYLSGLVHFDEFVAMEHLKGSLWRKGGVSLIIFHFFVVVFLHLQHICCSARNKSKLIVLSV